MSRKNLIYAMLLGMLLLLNIGRIWFEADESASAPDADQDHITGRSARFELVGLAEDEVSIGTVARDIFAPVRPQAITAVTAPPREAAPATPQPSRPSEDDLARERAQAELDKFKLAGVLINDSQITAMLAIEKDHYVVGVGERIGEDVFVQVITFDEVVIANQEWGVERILTIANAGSVNQD